jgi:ubiquinone/menaquinone biosynthesis C-methylase UbiE
VPEHDRREVARLVELLGLPFGARVLDVPCGQGRHSHLLAEAGFEVDGVDYSSELLRVARARPGRARPRYARANMCRLPVKWTNRFEAVVNVSTSFGFFLDPADDARVLAEFARVLKDDGVLVWHGGSRDGVMAKFLDRDWWMSADGMFVGQEREFDPLSGILTVRSTWTGKKASGFREHRLRLYTATRLAEMCRDVGLLVIEAFDGWSHRPLSRRSSEMLLVARKER